MQAIIYGNLFDPFENAWLCVRIDLRSLKTLFVHVVSNKVID